MQVRAFARLIGKTHTAVLKACRSGRLKRSVTRDDQGRVTDIDPEIGRQEWERRSRVDPALYGPKPKPAPPPASFGAVHQGAVERVAELIRELLAETAEVAARRFATAAVAGAADALRASGREATPEVLAEALDLAAGLDGAALQLAVALAEVAGEEPPGALECARAAGFAAAGGQVEEVAHGDA